MEPRQARRRPASPRCSSTKKSADDEIEKLKQGDLLESSFGEFASDSPELYDSVIAERDRYMAARLRESRTATAREVLAVVGAGHLQGMARHLREETRDPATIREELESVKEKSSFPWFTIALAVFVLGGFAWGFWHGGLEVGSDLLLHWVLFTGALGAIGCAVAGGHPLSILAAFLASPITPLHPALASGTLSALVEAWVRKPTYADFMALRDDVQSSRLVPQPRRARAAELLPHQPGHRDRRVDRRCDDAGQIAGLIRNRACLSGRKGGA